MKSITYLYIFLLVLLIVPTVTAFEFDNIKTFEKNVNQKYGSINIENIYGLGSTLATYTLENNTDQCLYYCHAEGTVTLFYEEKLFSDIKFLNSERKLSNISDYGMYIEDGTETYAENIV